MTVTISLDAPAMDRLRQEAEKLGVTAESHAEGVLLKHFGSTPSSSTIANDAAFQRAMADTFRENDELYRRLAK